MKLKKDFETAVIALRTAFKSALDDPDFDDNKLAEVWRHFLGMQAIWKSLPEDTDTIQFDSNLNISYDEVVKGLGDGYVAAGPVNIYGSEGKDVITF